MNESRFILVMDLVLYWYYVYVVAHFSLFFFGFNKCIFNFALFFFATTCISVFMYKYAQEAQLE